MVRFSLLLLLLLFHGSCPGLPAWASTRWNINSLTPILIILYLLPPSTTIHTILHVQFTCLTVFFCTTSVQVFFGQPLGLAPSTSYSIHFFTQTLPSFRNTFPYQRNSNTKYTGCQTVWIFLYTVLATSDSTHTHTHTQQFYCSSGICPGPPGWAGTRKAKPGRLKLQTQHVDKNVLMVCFPSIRTHTLTQPYTHHIHYTEHQILY